MKESTGHVVKKKILLIEDNIDTQLIYKVYLREIYDLEIAANAESGLKLLNEKQFDLVVLDINLPGKLSGSDVLQEIKNGPGYPDVPVLVVTAYAMKSDMEKFISQGADDYLAKPVNKDDFLERVGGLLPASEENIIQD